MRLRQLKLMKRQLDQYVERFKGELGRSERRYWCKLYLMGLFDPAQRNGQIIKPRILSASQSQLG